MNYYNEIDLFCCDWLRRLMAAGDIPKGFIDDRDIRDVRPELTGLRGLVKSARRNRVGRLKGYGNSVSPPVTAAFITACMEPF